VGGRAGAWAPGPPGGVPVKIRVDPDKCQGHARCYGLAPELFEIDDYGSSTVVGDGSVPPALQDRAWLAIANCPEFAIDEVDGS
jgi:ferredoxin